LDEKNKPCLHTANAEVFPLVGSVELEVQLGEKQFVHRFLVAARMPNPIRCLLGNDILAELGIRLVGLSASNPISKDAKASVVETAKLTSGVDLGYDWVTAISKLEMSNKAVSNYPDLLLTYRARLMEKIQPDLDINQAIKGFCSHEAATIFFHTDDEKPVMYANMTCHTSIVMWLISRSRNG